MVQTEVQKLKCHLEDRMRILHRQRCHQHIFHGGFETPASARLHGWSFSGEPWQPTWFTWQCNEKKKIYIYISYYICKILHIYIVYIYISIYIYCIYIYIVCVYIYIYIYICVYIYIYIVYNVYIDILFIYKHLYWFTETKSDWPLKRLGFHWFGCLGRGMPRKWQLQKMGKLWLNDQILAFKKIYVYI